MRIITYQTEGGEIDSSYGEILQRILDSSDAEIELKFESAGHKLEDLFNSWDGKSNLIYELIDLFPDSTNIRILISTTSTSKFANYCKSELGHAAWGCCLGGFVAVEYSPDARLTTQLHESLHLFGVEECYDESTLKPLESCTNDRCLMRYGVRSNSVCSSVCSQLRS